MSENPLLPHRKLKELHTLMLRCRELEQKQRARAVRSAGGRAVPPQAGREAVLAATSMQLLPGDLLIGEPGDVVVPELAPPAKGKNAPAAVAAASGLSRLGLAAAAAQGLKAAGTDGLVLAFARAGVPEDGWAAALEWAHGNQFPLLMACTDATDGKAGGKSGLIWETISRLSKRTKLPVLLVDGEDAVAVYRAMQEAVIRARYGGGPAVLWAMLTPLSAKRPSLARNLQPVARLNSYLTARKIVLPR